MLGTALPSGVWQEVQLVGCSLLCPVLRGSSCSCGTSEREKELSLGKAAWFYFFLALF